MAYPYGSLATGKADGTNLQTDHPAHHNAMASALNDLLTELGSDPGGGSDVTARLTALELGKVADTGDTMSGQLVVPSLSVAGITGATSGARFVGATASGAPASGTFSVGDWVIDRSGQMWICTVAGSPGTWVAPGSGRQLAYAEVTAAPTSITAVGSGSRVDVDSALTITITAGSRPISLQAQFGSVNNGTAAAGYGFAIVEGTIGGGIGTVIQQSIGTSSTAGAAGHVTISRSLSPSAGSHTYKLMGWAVVGGTVAISGATTLRPFLKAVEE